jgi:hypothetical protein
MLDLMDETTDQGSGFHQKFPNLLILKPEDFLREVRTSSPQPGDSGKT